MTFEKDTKTFLNAFNNAIEREDIKNEILSAGISREYIQLNILKKSEQIWNIVNSDIANYNSINSNISSQLKIEKKNKERFNFHNMLRKLRVIAWGGIIIISIATIALSIFNIELLMKILNFQISLWGLILTSLFFLVIIISEVLIEKAHKKRILFYDEGLKKSTDSSYALKLEREKVKELIQNKLTERGIIPEIYALINAFLVTSYTSVLNLSHNKGLSEVHNQDLEVQTKSKENLIHLLNDMPGGSIGISGPRGVGKTTLLTSFMNYTTGKINNKDLLTIFINAPVNYELREFIVHIFQRTINSFLNLKGVKESSNYNLFERDVKRNYLLQSLVSKLSPLLSAIGISFLILAFIIAFAKTSNVTEKSEPTVSENQPKENKSEKTISFFEALDINNGNLISIGVICLILGIGSSAFMSFNRNALRSQEESQKQYSDYPDNVLKAIEWQKNLKYQQSFTSGWSGALKFPIGLEGGINSSNSLQLNPLSLPEIIEGFKKFLTTLGKEFTVVISIDELDKMESNGKVIEFFNEIKSVFGVENSFFLVSVSEDAVSNFEQRGLPFRDVFDSSFDDVIHMDYFSYDESKELLNKRVIGLPVPYVLLSHCLSGGLPRDLIRIIRKLIQISEEIGAKDMSSITTSFLQNEIKSKLRSLMFKLNKQKIISEMELVAKCMIELDNENFESKILLENLNGCRLKLIKLDKDGNLQDTINLVSNLSNYLELLDVTRKYFISIVDWKKDFNDTKHRVEKIAFAKQTLSINPNLGNHIIKEVISEIKTATNTGNRCTTL